MSLRDKYTDEEWWELVGKSKKPSNKIINNSLDYNYQNLLKDIINNGTKKETRNGGTKSIFGYQFRHKMEEGFPLLTTKKLSFNNIRTELEWFLNGDTDIRFLWKNNNHIWDGDWYKNYLKQTSSPYSLKEMIQFGLEWEDNPRFFNKSIWDLGPIYGSQWRKWRSHQINVNKNSDGSGTIKYQTIDQIQNLINEIKENPNSRRLMVNAWNVDDLNKMVLPPCHYGFQIYIRDLSTSERYRIWFTNNYETGMEYDESKLPDFDNSYYKYTPSKAISLMWNQRSVDVGLGLPYNIASYGLLLKMLADEFMMVADELIGNLGDCHLYLNHIEPISEQIKRIPFPLPKLTVMDGIYSRGKGDFILTDYQYHPAIKLPLSN